MTALKQRLVRMIANGGPIPVSDFMALCLFDPQHGYYTSREPFGRGGDFITAPEISQMFGELAAAWLYAAWSAAGRPENPVFAEIGPGRGTMMADMLRSWAKLDPAFAQTARVAMIEASPRLTAIQKQTLQAAPLMPSWHGSLAGLPEGPLFLIGNELFDAIPVRQFIKTAEGWRERLVGVDESGEPAIVTGAGGCDPAILPKGEAPAGAIFEYAPQREALMQDLCERLAAAGGAALFFDYGHLEPGYGDTLQAMRAHQFDGVFDHPGEADLTSHVDFSALAAVARASGLQCAILTQGDFLTASGINQRASRLARNAGPEVQQRLAGEAERLTGAMGQMFKVLAAAQPGLALSPLPGFSAAD